MGFLTPSAKGKGASASSIPSIVVNGKMLRFNKVTTAAIGLDKTDSVAIYLGEKEDGEENRMYFLANRSDASQFKLNGKQGKPRAFADANVVTVARLGSDTYPLTEATTGKTKGWYLEFNPNNPVPSMEKRAKTPRSKSAVVKDVNKATAETIKENRSAGKVAQPAKR